MHDKRIKCSCQNNPQFSTLGGITTKWTTVVDRARSIATQLLLYLSHHHHNC